ncbi:MAG: hypothetical protein HY809_07105 [Nitrospirae bacterium]|nr:hypothetical protein [Nitrospirota bacterium]
MNKLYFLKWLIFPALIIFCAASCSSDKGAVRDSGVSEAEESFIKANEKIQNQDYEGAKELLEKVKISDATGEFSALA